MGHKDVVQTLIDHGGYPEETNELNHTALMEAAAAGHLGAAEVLVNHGAAVMNTNMEFKETAFTLAALKGQCFQIATLAPEYLLYYNVERIKATYATNGPCSICAFHLLFKLIPLLVILVAEGNN